MAGLIVGYDGSEGARVALDEAVRLGVALGEPVHLVFSFSAPRIGGELRDRDEAIAERGAAVLEHGVHHAQAAGLTVTTEQRKADPAEGLLEAARERDARMIVVGSSGERLLRSVLVGSTPTKLLHLADRPVLVVPVPE
jgi:nucleotide-binding universal stress UspA family protein